MDGALNGVIPLGENEVNGKLVKHYQQESLRVELAQQVQSAELLAEERNSYRAQVLEMNSALKNSLEHIKELRSLLHLFGLTAQPLFFI